jgi:uncharacterized protein YijF (DUF1287 family)
MTPASAIGSIFRCAIVAVISHGCSSPSEAHPDPAPPLATATPSPAPAAAVAGERCLGVADKGIFGDLDAQVQLALPAGLTSDRVSARIDEAHGVLVLAIDGFPRKAYPLGGASVLAVGAHTLHVRPGDHDELRDLVVAARLTAGPATHDRDDDGIPDPLDVLIGAKKAVLNADAYTPAAEGYISLAYPNGDVPRTMGVCTDVIIRSVRNAGLDLQQALHDDIAKARSAYPMVRGRGDPSIDQRRVGTLLPYFKRHWESHTARLDDPGDPLRPGDVILMDTFPSREGPDHIGILSDRVDAQGLPLVINNWTDGTVTAELDLLTFVPVMYRFRLPA